MWKLILSVVCCVALAAGADISGKWEFKVELDAGSGSPSFEFKQAGEKLTGTYNGLLGSAELKGAVKRDDVEFQFTVSGQGQTAAVHYKGKLEGEKQMKGTVEYGEFGKGTFTAVKK